MNRLSALGMAVALAVAAPASAEKISKEFRAQFESKFPPGRVWGVVMQRGVPTTSIYGTDGNATAEHYSIDVLSESDWKNSGGLLDVDQVAVDFLDQGEVMELESIAWKDNRIDLRWVSVESKKVTRGEWPFKTTKREPVATNFKFFLPYPKTHTLASRDLADVVAFVSNWVRPFRTEDDARNFAARWRTGGDGGAPSTRQRPPVDEPRSGDSRSAPRSEESRGSSRSAAPQPESRPQQGAPAKREIAVGMTPLQVIDILGKPKQELTFQNQQKWTYPEIVVIFENGKVKEVRF
ncbi:MAG: hypothetical protein NDJ94_01970 [Vicinamibacteria bacterium]|nr:hypothetical protein [Vicinamibacteria bacterium]